jgi:hypothetical protein
MSREVVERFETAMPLLPAAGYYIVVAVLSFAHFTNKAINKSAV